LSANEAVITAIAQGHGDEVIRAFREAASIVFTRQGPWRITQVHGLCFPEMRLDSDMEWSLRAERKVDHLIRNDDMNPG
jgi:hypothetical protein